MANCIMCIELFHFHQECKRIYVCVCACVCVCVCVHVVFLCTGTRGGYKGDIIVEIW